METQGGSSIVYSTKVVTLFHEAQTGEIPSAPRTLNQSWTSKSM